MENALQPLFFFFFLPAKGAGRKETPVHTELPAAHEGGEPNLGESGNPTTGLTLHSQGYCNPKVVGSSHVTNK